MFEFQTKEADTVRYTRLEDQAPEAGNGSLLPDRNLFRRVSTIRSEKPALPWMISTIFLAVLSASLIFLQDIRNVTGTFETGFRTDLAAIRSEISIQTVRFDGSPSFTEDGEEFVPDHPGKLRYVGEPSSEVDDAWNELTKERYFLLSEEEAHNAWGSEYEEFWNEYWGGYLAGLDVFHTLHCLDHLRQAFYPDYYPQTILHGKLHNVHCIDHIRQMVQCYADATPIPSRYYPGLGQNYIDSDQVHTCRNFAELRAWTSERYNGSAAVEPKFRQPEGGKHSH
ncbi:MAG: hypothetical protein MMC33_010356 [Icmadophila ericetorum]|nr:hypothetical protein [Icmadophila ericetorum]